VGGGVGAADCEGERVGSADGLACGEPLAVADAVPEEPSTDRVCTLAQKQPTQFVQNGSARKLRVGSEPGGTLTTLPPLASQG
jgi:hypothetical protein